MSQNWRSAALTFKKRHRNRRALLAGFLVLAIGVTLLTSYALSQPAISVAGELICPLPEHTHSESCYVLTCKNQDPDHVHTEECYAHTQKLICTNTDPQHVHTAGCYERLTTCGLQEHSHGQNCYQTEPVGGTGLSGKTRDTTGTADPGKIQDTTGTADPGKAQNTTGTADPGKTQDTTGTADPGKIQDTTGTADPGKIQDTTGTADPGKTQDTTGTANPGKIQDTTGTADPGKAQDPEQADPSDETAQPQKPVSRETEDGRLLVCTLPEHTHGEDCWEKTLICQNEDPDHVHTEECYEKKLICPLQEHSHGEECYRKLYCGLREHTHSEDCWELICGNTDPNHVHTEECYAHTDTLICGQEEGPDHSHTAACYERKTVCGLPEHHHRDACLVPPPPRLPEGVPETHTDLRVAPEGSLPVRIYARPGTLPEGVAPVAESIQRENPRYSQVLQQLTDSGASFNFLKVLDISLRDPEGREIQPQEAVYVELPVAELLPDTAVPESLVIRHHRVTVPADSASLAEDPAGDVPDSPAFMPMLMALPEPDFQVVATGGENLIAADGKSTAIFAADGFSPYSVTASNYRAAVLSDRVSTNRLGIEIKLFDYDQTSINRNRTLNFTDGGGTGLNGWTGHDIGPGNPRQGIVQAHLGPDGYPRLNAAVAGSEESLAYLFDGSAAPAHTLDGLFHKSGNQFTYDSDYNFAEVPQSGGSFIVYDSPQTIKPSFSAEVPKFLPFNHMPDINENNINYYFGMSMKMDFLMPAGGMVDGQPMTFNFKGDDDVWVFVDDKLVLDLGGIHNSITGSINFSTGQVFINDSLTSARLYPEGQQKTAFPDYTRHTLKFFYLERGGGGSNCKLQFNLVPMTHNLSVGKRLPTDTRQQASMAPILHLNYKFQLETWDPDPGYDPVRTVRKPLPGATATLFQNGVQVGTLTTDQDGCFTIKANQRALFSDQIKLDAASSGSEDIRDDVWIYVSELVPSAGSPIQKVTAAQGAADKENTYVTATDSNGRPIKTVPPLYDAEGTNYHTETVRFDDNPSSAPVAGYDYYTTLMTSDRGNGFNWVDFENSMGDLAQIHVTKAVEDTGAQPMSPDRTFRLRIELWDEEAGDWVRLPADTPYSITAAGVTHDPDEIMENLSQTPVDDEGCISIRKDQTVHMNLVPGTRYRVYEVLDGGDLFEPSYSGTVSNGTETLTVVETATETAPACIHNGAAEQGSQHNITVKNTGDFSEPARLEISKKVAGQAPPGEEFSVKVELAVKDGAFASLPENTPYERFIESSAEPPEKLASGKNGILKLQAGETLRLYLPAGTRYRVTEQLTLSQQSIYTPSYSGEVLVPDADPLQITETGIENTAAQSGAVHQLQITNTGIQLRNGELALTKLVKGKQPAEDTQFHFYLKINGYHETGWRALETYTVQAEYMGTPPGLRGNSQEQITLTGTDRGGMFNTDIQDYETRKLLTLYPGETVVLRNLPKNYSLTIEERECPTYYTTRILGDIPGGEVAGTKVSATNQVTANTSVRVTFENTNTLRDLTVSKTLQHLDLKGQSLELTEAEKAAEFAFTVSLANTGWTGGTKTVNALDGSPLTFTKSGDAYVSELSLTQGKSVTLTDLPDGTQATVTETTAPSKELNFTTQVNGGDGSTVQLELTENRTAAFLNTVQDVPGTGTLQISKKVKINGADAAADPTQFTFRAELTKLPEGTGDSLSFETQASQDGLTYEAGEPLTFTKTPEGVYRSASFTLSHGQSLRILGLPEHGEAAVTEELSPGYAASWQGSGVAEGAVAQSHSIRGKPIEADQITELECINATGSRMPNTGGAGTGLYYLTGMVLISLAGYLLFRKREVRGA